MTAEVVSIYEELPETLDQGTPSMEVSFARGSIASQIAGCDKILDVISRLPADTSNNQQAALTAKKDSLSSLLLLSDDDLLLALRLETEADDESSTPQPVTLMLVEPPTSVEVEDEETEKYITVEDALSALRTAVIRARNLPGEEPCAALYEIFDGCEAVEAEINETLYALEDTTSGDSDTAEIGAVIDNPTVHQEPSIEVSAPIEATEIAHQPPIEGRQADAPPSVLPEGFIDTVLAMVNADPTVYIWDITREVFGVPELERSVFQTMRHTLNRLIADGALQARGSRGFSLPEEQRKEVVARRALQKAKAPAVATITDHSTAALEEKLRAAGIRQASSPRSSNARG